MQFYTYLHCKPDGDIFYVGKGTNGRSHDLTLKRNTHHKNIVAKYGAENIGVYVFPCASEEEAFADEIYLIAQLRSEGYELVNQTNGGEGASVGHAVSQETRAKIAFGNMGNKKCLGKKNAFGHKYSQETLEKMSAAKRGKKFTLEHRANMVLAQRSRPLEWRANISAARVGMKFSSETRSKMSKAAIVRCARERAAKI